MTRRSWLWLLTSGIGCSGRWAPSGTPFLLPRDRSGVPPGLLALAVQETPAIVALLEGLYRATHPDPVTREDVIAAWQAALGLAVTQHDQTSDTREDH